MDQKIQSFANGELENLHILIARPTEHGIPPEMRTALQPNLARKLDFAQNGNVQAGSAQQGSAQQGGSPQAQQGEGGSTSQQQQQQAQTELKPAPPIPEGRVLITEQQSPVRVSLVPPNNMPGGASTEGHVIRGTLGGRADGKPRAKAYLLPYLAAASNFDQVGLYGFEVKIPGNAISELDTWMANEKQRIKNEAEL